MHPRSFFDVLLTAVTYVFGWFVLNRPVLVSVPAICLDR